MTELQRTILKTVLNSKEHLTAEQIYFKVKKTVPTVALGSVYRNLNNFAQSGLIRRVVRSRGPDIYEENTKPHNHLVCAECGKMKDLEIETLDHFLANKIPTPVINVDLVVTSICPTCEAKMNKKGPNLKEVCR